MALEELSCHVAETASAEPSPPAFQQLSASQFQQLTSAVLHPTQQQMQGAGTPSEELLGRMRLLV